MEPSTSDPSETSESSDELVYNPFAYAIHEDPYPTYARMRDEAPGTTTPSWPSGR
jgi:hypothetical protein